MASERRRDLATATVGATGIAAGGVGRHVAINRMADKPKVHLVGVLRRGTRGQKKLFLGSSALGLASVAPFSVGVTRLAHGDEVQKKDERRGFWREGLHGSAEALRGRGESAVTPVPKEVRGMQLGAAAGAGLAGSGVARLMLPRGVRPVAGPLSGALAATGSIPATNKLIQRKHPEYKVTAFGVQRQKKPIVRASSKSSAYRSDPRSFRADLAKRDGDDPGWRDVKASMRAHEKRNGLPAGTWRTVGTRGGGTLFEYVPGEEPLHSQLARVRADRKARDVREAAKAKKESEELRDFNGRLQRAGIRSRKDPRRNKARHVVKRDDNRYLGARTSYPAQRAAVTLAGHPPVIGPFTSAATAGSYAPPGQHRKAAVRQWTMGSGAGMVTGTAGAYAGAHLAGKSPRAEHAAERIVAGKDRMEAKARSLLHVRPKKPIDHDSRAGRLRLKALASGPGKALLGKDPARHNARMLGATAGFLGTKAITGAVLGQAAISLNQRDQTKYNRAHGIAKRDSTKREKHVLAERKRHSAALQTIGGTAGLTGLALLAAGKKGPATSAGIIGGGVGGANALLSSNVQRREAKVIDPVQKRDYREPLKTSVSEDDARKLVERHGLKGPLPKNLDREQRRAAYEARYVTAGGHKAERWQHRAVMADKVKTTGLGVATAAGVPWVASRTGAGRALGRAVAHRAPLARKVDPKKLQHHAETVAGAAATVGGAGELYAAHARRKRSSYASAPGGVAASALRRMQAYDTEAS